MRITKNLPQIVLGDKSKDNLWQCHMMNTFYKFFAPHIFKGQFFINQIHILEIPTLYI